MILRRSIIELCRDDHQDDAATLAAWLANKTPAHVHAWIGDTDNYLLIAEADGAVLGVAAMRNSGRISLNYVSPAARFRGVSKALLRALEDRARELGLLACSLESTQTARRFYLSIGYSEAGPPTPGFGVSLCHPMVKALVPKI